MHFLSTWTGIRVTHNNHEHISAWTGEYGLYTHEKSTHQHLLHCKNKSFTHRKHINIFYPPKHMLHPISCFVSCLLSHLLCPILMHTSDCSSIPPPILMIVQFIHKPKFSGTHAYSVRKDRQRSMMMMIQINQRCVCTSLNLVCGTCTATFYEKGYMR